MTNDIVKSIISGEDKLEKYTSSLGVKDSLLEATACLRAAKHIQTHLSQKLFSDTDWHFHIDENYIRIWHSLKSDELPGDEYYHVYFNPRTLEVINSTLTDADLEEVKSIIGMDSKETVLDEEHF